MPGQAQLSARCVARRPMRRPGPFDTTPRVLDLRVRLPFDSGPLARRRRRRRRTPLTCTPFCGQTGTCHGRTHPPRYRGGDARPPSPTIGESRWSFPHSPPSFFFVALELEYCGGLPGRWKFLIFILEFIRSR